MPSPPVEIEPRGVFARIRAIMSVAISIDPPRTARCDRGACHVEMKDEFTVPRTGVGGRIHCSMRIWFSARGQSHVLLSLPSRPFSLPHLKRGVVCFYCRCRFVRQAGWIKFVQRFSSPTLPKSPDLDSSRCGGYTVSARARKNRRFRKS